MLNRQITSAQVFFDVLVGVLRGGPVQSVEVGHGQYSITGCLIDDLRDPDEGVVAIELAECGDIGGLVTIIDFLGDARRRSRVLHVVDQASRSPTQRGGQTEKRSQQFSLRPDRRGSLVRRPDTES